MLYALVYIISQAGYYGFDRVTPILPNTFDVALESAWIALTGADLLLRHVEGSAEAKGPAGAVYSLCRPPGHHAHADLFGG